MKLSFDGKVMQAIEMSNLVGEDRLGGLAEPSIIVYYSFSLTSYHLTNPNPKVLGTGCPAKKPIP